MRVLLLLLLRFTSISSRKCTKSDIKYVFTPCARNHTRAGLFYWGTECESGQLPVTRWDLDCDLQCPAGSILGLNEGFNASSCELCPVDSYSPGGGYRVKTGDWGTEQWSFRSHCSRLSADWMTSEETLCTNWAADHSGDFLISGKNNETAWIQTELIYYVNLTTSGNFTLKYSKNSKQMGNFHNGMFKVVVNNKVIWVDNTKPRQIWRTVSADLTPGPCEITLSFLKFNDKNHYNSEVKLSDFEVNGVVPAAHFCVPCTKGWSSQGASECQKCEENTYLDTSGERHVCKSCPATHYSHMGSIGFQSCKIRPKCGFSDYYTVLSPCREGNRTREYHWKQPIHCDISSASLPDPVIGIPCELCNAGFYHKPVSVDNLEVECSACPSGTALIEHYLNDTCMQCPAGTYARPTVNITHWLPSPQGFETSKEPESCRDYNGWTAYDSLYITSNESVVSPISCDFILERVVNILQISGNIEFSLHFSKESHSNSWVNIEVNDQLFASFPESTASNEPISIRLELGQSTIRWTHHQEDNSAASISSILIVGVDEGGAGYCVPCPVRYFSANASSTCTPCAPGYTHTPDRTSCQRCPVNMISTDTGCETCPFNTEANSEQTMCIGLDYLSWGMAGYNISRLTGRNGHNICESNPRLQLLCSGNVYGPVILNNDVSFYFSILNPGNMSNVHYYEPGSGAGYAWGLYPYNNPQKTLNEDCESTHTLVNLGSKIEEIRYTLHGFSILYSQGSICPAGNSHYTTEIEFICDKEEGDGWPQFINHAKCNYFFTWRSKIACRQCQDSELQVITGRCIDNIRQIQTSEPSFCLYFPNSTSQIIETDCNSAADFAATWFAIGGGVVIVTLFIAIVMLVWKLCNMQHRYQLLMRESDSHTEKEA